MHYYATIENFALLPPKILSALLIRSSVPANPWQPMSFSLSLQLRADVSM